MSLGCFCLEGVVVKGGGGGGGVLPWNMVIPEYFLLLSSPSTTYVWFWFLSRQTDINFCCLIQHFGRVILLMHYNDKVLRVCINGGNHQRRMMKQTFEILQTFSIGLLVVIRVPSRAHPRVADLATEHLRSQAFFGRTKSPGNNNWFKMATLRQGRVKEVFLWLMAVIYLFAFSSLYVQIPGGLSALSQLCLWAIVRGFGACGRRLSKRCKQWAVIIMTL